MFLLYNVSQLSFRYFRIMKFTSTIQYPNRFIKESIEIPRNFKNNGSNWTRNIRFRIGQMLVEPQSDKPNA